MQIIYRQTWAEVSLVSLSKNFQSLRNIIPVYTKVMACVKADAYGHGLVQVAQKLAQEEVEYFGVASIDEGVKLRQSGIKVPILILGLVLNKDILPLFDFKLTPTVSSLDFARALNKVAIKRKQNLCVHIKIDTGMGRIGFLPEEAKKAIIVMHQFKTLFIEGLFTHLACADINRSFTLQQLEAFNKVVRQLALVGVRIPLLHAANSMGVMGYKESHFNMVRPGLALYGLSPRATLKVKLEPVLSLKSKVVYTKKLPAGYGLSYGHDYVTKHNTNIVTIPIGYGDGYPRNLSNIAPVLIGGKRFKVSGRVCMDQLLVDVGKNNIKAGSEVVLIGKQGKNSVTVDELAKLSQTISYEIVCGLGSRIPRVYI